MSTEKVDYPKHVKLRPPSAYPEFIDVAAVMFCENCEGKQTLPSPVSIRVLQAMMDAFARLHLHGEPIPTVFEQNNANADLDMEITSVECGKEGEMLVHYRPSAPVGLRLIEEMALSFGEVLKHKGAENFVSMSYRHPDPEIGEMWVVLQRRDGKQPEDLRRELQDRIKNIPVKTFPDGAAACAALPPEQAWADGWNACRASVQTPPPPEEEK